MIISNTSPISNLAVINHLDILPILFNEIFISPAVESELLEYEPIKEKIIEAEKSGWLKIIQISNLELVDSLLPNLNIGESESIVVARENNARLLLLDERKATRIASLAGIKTLGVLGVLLYAKSKKIVPEIKPVIDKLIREAGFWIKEDVYLKVLKSANEIE